MKTTIYVYRNEDLTSQQWAFWYFDDKHALVLDYYARSERPTKRHNYCVVGNHFYNRLDGRNSGIQEGDVPLPDDVLAEAKEKFAESLRVVKWSER